MNARPTDLRFGIFMPPFHHTGQNPTRLLHRDLELLEQLDDLGYDEAWVGEHHSGGFEIISSPEVFLAAAAMRTSRIKLATGVVSLPYHHPYMVAERVVLLDHLSRGRAILGVGPGSIPHDASMLGLTMSQTRPRMEEAWEVIHHLITSAEPITRKTDWFVVEEATLQVMPTNSLGMEIAFTAFESPFGPSLAGKYGGGLVSLGATTTNGFGALSRHWSVVEEQAALYDRAASRRNWRVVAPMHIAETREQARAEVMHGFGQFVEYNQQVAGRDLEWMVPEAGREMSTLEDVLDFMVDDLHFACVGTPEDALAFIDRLQEQTGGFGCLLLNGNDWATPEATRRSVELIADEVFPHFQGSLDAVNASFELGRQLRDEAVREQRDAVREAQQRYGVPDS